MEIIAIVIGVIVFIFAVMCLLDECERNVGYIMLLVAILLQLFWFPQTFDTRIETETYITNKHNNYSFERPVQITKTRTYKPFSALTDETIYEVKFLN